MGVERLLALMQILDCPLRRLEPAVYVVTQGDKAARLAVSLCEELRDRVPRLRLMKDVGGGSFKSQFKRADKSGAHLALVLGDAEADSGQVQIKPLRSDAAQQTIAVKELAAWLETHVPPTH
jgi:histidyl-tRNA synthetase